MYSFKGKNPSELFLNTLSIVLKEGSEYSPRGKKIKEIRPVCVEFTNPLARTICVKGRRPNPFFLLAEALWIISGRSDAGWIRQYTTSLDAFSDDGVHFNAPYGERLRAYNRNNLRGFIFNPIDQLLDVYRKLKEDQDTRQAVAVIYNPLFDNADYTIDEKGKDIACNLLITFKIRDNALDITVFNRSNDALWGLFNANIVQFSTIQEMVASWLGVKVGTYCHITDSLHVYTEDYGFKQMELILKEYPQLKSGKYETPPVFFTKDEPRFDTTFEQMSKDLVYYWNVIDPVLLNISSITVDKLLNAIDSIKDSYIKHTVSLMAAYRYQSVALDVSCARVLENVPYSQWKVACMKFLMTGKNPMSQEIMQQALNTLPYESACYVTE